MRLGSKTAKSIMVLAVLWIESAPCLVRAQVSNAAVLNVILSSGQTGVPAANPAAIVREIDDPHLGNRWLLVRDPDHPGGPGRLLIASASMPEIPARRPGGLRHEAAVSPLVPVIRAGERVVVEESSPVVEAHLEGVALGPALLGSALAVRLKAGGRILHALALGPARAALLPENRVQP